MCTSCNGSHGPHSVPYFFLVFIYILVRLEERMMGKQRMGWVYILSVWLVLTTQQQNIIPCSEWVVSKSSGSFIAHACIEKSNKVLWEKQFKNKREAEKYRDGSITLPSMDYSIIEDFK